MSRDLRPGERVWAIRGGVWCPAKVSYMATYNGYWYVRWEDDNTYSASSYSRENLRTPKEHARHLLTE